MQGYQKVLAWLNLTAPQLKNIQANAPPKTAESIKNVALRQDPCPWFDVIEDIRSVPITPSLATYQSQFTS